METCEHTRLDRAITTHINWEKVTLLYSSCPSNPLNICLLLPLCLILCLYLSYSSVFHLLPLTLSCPWLLSLILCSVCSYYHLGFFYTCCPSFLYLHVLPRMQWGSGWWVIQGTKQMNLFVHLKMSNNLKRNAKTTQSNEAPDKRHIKAFCVKTKSVILTICPPLRCLIPCV